MLKRKKKDSNRMFSVPDLNSTGMPEASHAAGVPFYPSTPSLVCVRVVYLSTRVYSESATKLIECMVSVPKKK